MKPTVMENKEVKKPICLLEKPKTSRQRSATKSFRIEIPSPNREPLIETLMQKLKLVLWTIMSRKSEISIYLQLFPHFCTFKNPAEGKN